MTKKHKIKLIISSLLILLPSLFGLLTWNHLPTQMAIHWNFSGRADGLTSRWVVVLLFPLILLAVHWLCLWISSLELRHTVQSPKVVGMVFWILPVISIYTGAVVYAAALGMTLSISFVLPFLGISFILIGNYLPKCKQNRTIGIKLPWTYSSEENWNRTHRLGGRLWVVGGLLFLLCIFLPKEILPIVTVALLLAMVLIPTIYSYWFYKKERRAGVAIRKGGSRLCGPTNRIASMIALILVTLLLIACAVICFTGNIEMRYDGDSFSVVADYYEDFHCAYDAVWSMEYRETFDGGTRVIGFGTPRLSLGRFKSEELGEYVRYGYTSCEAAILLRIEGNTMVAISGRDAEETRAIYEKLMSYVLATPDSPFKELN